MKYAKQFCTCEEVFSPEHMYVFSGKCKVTQKPFSVTVKAEEMFAYNQGKLIQDAMPSLSVDERELLITGISPEGWEIFDAKLPNLGEGSE